MRIKPSIFGMPRFGTSLILGLRDFVTLFLYTEVFALSGTLTGLATFLGYIAIAISQFSMGWISDRVNTRWGRRRPFVLFGTPVLAISFFMLFTPPLFLGGNPGEINLFLWLLVWKCMFEFFYGFVTTPYQAMLPEITEVQERPRASTWQNVFNFLGAGTATVITLLGISKMTEEIKVTKVLTPEFILVFLICAIISVALLLLFCFKMPKEEEKFITKQGFRENFKVIWANKNFLRVTLFQGLASLAFAMTQSMMLGFVVLVLQFEGVFYYLASIFLLVGLLAFLNFWKKSIERRGKKWTLEKILIFGIILIPFSLLGLLQGASLAIFGLLYILIVAAMLGGWNLFPYILYADLSEDDARATNNFKAGLYTGFPSIPLNIFQGLSILLIGFLKDNVGFIPGLVPAASYGYIIFGPLASAFLIIALIYLRKRVKIDFTWEKGQKQPQTTPPATPSPE